MSALTCVAEIAQAVNEFDMYGMEYPDSNVFVNSTVPEWIYGRDIDSFRKKIFFSSFNNILKISKCDFLHELVV